MENNWAKQIGKCCVTCHYYNNMTGHCAKRDSYTHGYDQYCNKWKIADDLKERRPRKKPHYEQMKLL